MQSLHLQNEWRGQMLNVSRASRSGAVVAPQEAAPEMQQSSCSHPDRLEEEEGEICKENIMCLMSSCLFFMFQSFTKAFCQRTLGLKITRKLRKSDFYQTPPVSA